MGNQKNLWETVQNRASARHREKRRLCQFLRLWTLLRALHQNPAQLSRPKALPRQMHNDATRATFTKECQREAATRNCHNRMRAQRDRLTRATSSGGKRPQTQRFRQRKNSCSARPQFHSVKLRWDPCRHFRRPTTQLLGCLSSHTACETTWQIIRKARTGQKKSFQLKFCTKSSTRLISNNQIATLIVQLGRNQRQSLSLMKSNIQIC